MVRRTSRRRRGGRVADEGASPCRHVHVHRRRPYTPLPLHAAARGRAGRGGSGALELVLHARGPRRALAPAGASARRVHASSRQRMLGTPRRRRAGCGHSRLLCGRTLHRLLSACPRRASRVRLADAMCAADSSASPRVALATGRVRPSRAASQPTAPQKGSTQAECGRRAGRMGRRAAGREEASVRTCGSPWAQVGAGARSSLDGMAG